MEEEKEKPSLEEVLSVLLTDDAFRYFTKRLMTLRPDLYQNKDFLNILLTYFVEYRKSFGNKLIGKRYVKLFLKQRIFTRKSTSPSKIGKNTKRFNLGYFALTVGG